MFDIYEKSLQDFSEQRFIYLQYRTELKHFM